MKTIEEKAKAYDEAIKRGLDYIRHTPATEMVTRQDIFEAIFPELAENKDEKMRKEIISALKFANHKGVYDEHIAWLEKQGESIRIKKGKNYLCTKTHKYAGMEWIEGVKYYSPEDYSLVNQGCTCYCPKYSKEEHNNFFKEVEYDGCLEVDKLEPKFKVKYAVGEYNVVAEKEINGVTFYGIEDEPNHIDYVKADTCEIINAKPKFKIGDWIISSVLGTAHIIGVNDYDEYQLEYIDGYRTFSSIDYVNYEYDKWTIQNAKDGDVLATSAGAFIYNGNNGGGCCPGCYCGIDTLGNFKTGTEHHWTTKPVFPATKEQRELLFKKMNESGYEWDANKKELKKVIIRPKFKVGDWIIHRGTENVYQVVAYIDKQYQLKYGDNYTIQKCDEVDRNARLWTIKDAKDGDVLVSQYNKPFIYNGNRDSFHIGSYCGISTIDRFIIENGKCRWTENVNIHPATKEQRDLLFQKIYEAGYEWDSEKKELKKIETQGGDE